MKTLILLLILTSTFAMAGGKLSVFFMQNGVERLLTWQCAELDECLQILETRVESQGECDPKVTKIVLERIHIPGLDD
jgi:hypothetical protein